MRSRGRGAAQARRHAVSSPLPRPTGLGCGRRAALAWPGTAPRRTPNRISLTRSSSTSVAPPVTRSPSATCTARTVAAYGETSGVSIFIASSTTSGWRASTASPGATSTRTTVPGIGATTDDCSVAGPPWRWAGSSTSGGGAGGGEGRLSRHGAAPRGRRAALGRARERRVVDEERGRRLAGAQLRVRDEPAEERQVRRHALDLGLGERGRELGRAPSCARGGVRDQLREQRVVRRCRPRRPPRRPRRRGSTPAAGAARSGRPGGGTCADPRRRGAPRPRAHAVTSCHLRSSSGSPRATRICCSTRSRPVTASVTGCSTWMRPFSSRKWKSRPSSTNSAVPAPT